MRPVLRGKEIAEEAEDEAHRRTSVPPERLPKRGDEMKRGTRRALLVLGIILAMGIVLAGTAVAQSQGGSFRIVRPEVAPSGCLEGASGDVMIQSFGPAEVMVVSVENLAPNSTFDLFLLQLPGRGGEDFGIASYEGDIETNAQGDGKGVFIGRFNRETFVMAPDSNPAPVVHDSGPFPDASSNPKFNPIHTYHLGVFFDSPGAARRGGCPDDVTPFNGTHRAGFKALSTINFPDDRGPLREVTVTN
jgi:hypothetical protein